MAFVAIQSSLLGLALLAILAVTYFSRADVFSEYDTSAEAILSLVTLLHAVATAVASPRTR